MSDCLFCRILAKELPAEILYENEHAVAVLDINPIHFGHALIVPRAHCKDFLELPKESFHNILDAAQIVAKALVQSFHLQGYNLFTNNGRIAGQSVFHFHLHITPRYANDNIQFVLKLKQYPDGELHRTAALIKQNITTS
ncbi:MAG: HIT domain-containing protein [Ignavibacteriales bacterium]|nr:HIT domain-containing protein [Ignavibacteriales bacterium]